MIGCDLGILRCICGVGRQSSLGPQDEMLSVSSRNYLNWGE